MLQHLKLYLLAILLVSTLRVSAQENLPGGNVCENGDFEDGYTNNYFFDTRATSELFSCDMLTEEFVYPDTGISGGYITPASVGATNSAIAPVSLVTVGNDATLHNLPVPYGPIDIPRVNGGAFAMKLNNDSPNFTLTSMSKVFTVSSDVVSYSFSLVVENPIANPQHPSYDQPHFIVRLYNSNNEKVEQQCIIADMTNTEMFFNANNDPDEPLLYTNWQCAFLPTSKLETGSIARIEFTITDCGQGQHFGTVYIDDICTDGECQPAYGDAELDFNADVECPEFPLSICGNFTPPHSVVNPATAGTLSSLTLSILQNGVLVNTINTPTLTGNDFCFDVDEADFLAQPTGIYEFEVTAIFSVGSETFTITESSTNPGPDADFTDCCLECVYVSAPVVATTDFEQAEICIYATNIIDATSSAIYHAGTEVVLQDGFLATAGSIDRFYVEDCTNSFVARPASANPVGNVIIEDSKDKTGLLTNILVYPNPAINELNLITKEGAIKSIILLSLDGKIILSNNVNARSYKVDTTAIAKGIYILSVELTNGEVTSHKVVKE